MLTVKKIRISLHMTKSSNANGNGFGRYVHGWVCREVGGRDSEPDLMFGIEDEENIPQRSYTYDVNFEREMAARALQNMGREKTMTSFTVNWKHTAILRHRWFMQERCRLEIKL